MQDIAKVTDDLKLNFQTRLPTLHLLLRNLPHLPHPVKDYFQSATTFSPRSPFVFLNVENSMTSFLFWRAAAANLLASIQI